jgi:hypothetical protein
MTRSKVDFQSDQDYYLNFDCKKAYLQKVAAWKVSYELKMKLLRFQKQQAKVAAQSRTRLFAIFNKSGYDYKKWYQWPKWALEAVRAGLDEITYTQTRKTAQFAAWLLRVQPYDKDTEKYKNALLRTTIQQLVDIRQLMRTKSHLLNTCQPSLHHKTKTTPTQPR